MNDNLKKQIWILLGGLIIVASFFFFFSSKTAVPIRQVAIGSKIINVEVAQTDAERTLGLSGHKPLADDEGMLFIFDTAGQYGFWMKDMLYPLDIIWISADRKITYIEKNLSPDSYPQVFTPAEPAQYVLEVNAGLSDKDSWNIGDTVQF